MTSLLHTNQCNSKSNGRTIEVYSSLKSIKKTLNHNLHFPFEWSRFTIFPWTPPGNCQSAVQISALGNHGDRNSSWLPLRLNTPIPSGAAPFWSPPSPPRESPSNTAASSKRRTLSKMLIHCFQKDHLSERNVRAQQQMGWEGINTTMKKIKKYSPRWPNYFSLFCFSQCFTVREMEEEALTRWNQTPFGGERKTQMQPFCRSALGSQSHAPQTARHPPSSRRCWSARSSFRVLFSSCPTSPPSQKSPAGLHYPLANPISSKKHTRGVATVFGNGWHHFLVFCDK